MLLKLAVETNLIDRNGPGLDRTNAKVFADTGEKTWRIRLTGPGAVRMTAAAELPLFPDPRRRRAPRPIERRTHIAVSDLSHRAARPERLWMHVPNGEHRTEETGALLERMGVMPGVFDFPLIGRTVSTIGSSCKRGRAPLSEAQKAISRGTDRPYSRTTSPGRSTTPLRACKRGASCGRSRCSEEAACCLSAARWCVEVLAAVR